MGAETRTRIEPVIVEHYDRALRATVADVTGWRATCRCGWIGQPQGTPHAARTSLYRHRDTCPITSSTELPGAA